MKKFLKIFLTTILVIILFISVNLLLLLIPLRLKVNEEAIKDVIVSLNIEEDLINNPDLEKGFENILNPVYKITREIGIEDEIVIKILNTNEVKEILGDITGNVYEAIVTGENQNLIGVSELEDIISKGIDSLNKSGIQKIDDNKKNIIINFIQENGNEFTDLLPKTDIILNDLDNGNEDILEIIRFVYANELVVFLVITTITSLLLIMLLNLNKMKWLKIASITNLIASIFNLIITSMISLMSNMYLKVQYNFLYGLVRNYVNLSYLITGLLFLVSLIIIIIYVVRCKNKNVKN